MPWSIERALVDARLMIFERYLLPPGTERMLANGGKQMCDWPPVIASLRDAMNARSPPSDPHVRQLAQGWKELSAPAGDDLAIYARIRDVYANESGLRSESTVDHAMPAHVRQAAPAQERPRLRYCAA